ncbi:hypothetical protein FKP32DRAFT_686550 [Trametes sanguinea]|nr:hypothetical protein FKP32DRAFT_686550 [Trametes sanguinea]
MSSINNETGSNASINRTNSNASGAGAGGNNDGYPEQKHAGAVGYGPEYGKGATTGDKLTGLKEEVKGKILRKPDVVEHGRELRTGEIKKKEQENENFDPFNTAKDDDSEQKDGGGNAGLNHPPSGAESSDASRPNPSMSFPPAASDPSHPTHKGAREQAATTAPEGTEKGQRQKSMGNTDKVAYFG